MRKGAKDDGGRQGMIQGNYIVLCRKQGRKQGRQQGPRRCSNLKRRKADLGNEIGRRRGLFVMLLMVSSHPLSTPFTRPGH